MAAAAPADERPAFDAWSKEHGINPRVYGSTVSPSGAYGWARAAWVAALEWLFAVPPRQPEPCAEATDAAHPTPRHWNPVYNTDPVQRACAELPEGWGVNACMERDAGWVEVYGPNGEEPDFESDADHFDWRIHEAIDFAIDAARAGGNA
ncbi:hypothetical protein WJ69_23045 [Burkholderia ubonensis]|nr:hypothetical protein WJ69_23045 [Burkholderia ubonensis]